MLQPVGSQRVGHKRVTLLTELNTNIRIQSSSSDSN